MHFPGLEKRCIGLEEPPPQLNSFSGFFLSLTLRITLSIYLVGRGLKQITGFQCFGLLLAWAYERSILPQPAYSYQMKASE